MTENLYTEITTILTNAWDTTTKGPLPTFIRQEYSWKQGKVHNTISIDILDSYLSQSLGTQNFFENTEEFIIRTYASTVTRASEMALEVLRIFSLNANYFEIRTNTPRRSNSMYYQEIVGHLVNCLSIS